MHSSTREYDTTAPNEVTVTLTQGLRAVIRSVYRLHLLNVATLIWLGLVLLLVACRVTPNRCVMHSRPLNRSQRGNAARELTWSIHGGRKRVVDLDIVRQQLIA